MVTVRHRSYVRGPHLWKRPPHGVYYITWHEDGAMQKRSTGTTRRADAEALLAVFLKDRESGARSPEAITLHQGIIDWLADRERPRAGLQPRTVDGYRRWADAFIEFFPATLLARDLMPHHVRQYLNRREDDGASPSTLKKELGGLAMVFFFLSREGHPVGNPCRAVRVRAKPKRHPAMTDEEFGQLRAALQDDLGAAYTAAEKRDLQELCDLAEVLWHSGHRFIDAVRLRWDDIDLDAMSWTIRAPENKGGEQTLPIHQAILPVLVRRKLLGWAGPFRDYWPLQRIWTSFKERHPEFKGWSWHRMRHAFVTRLRRLGMDAAAQALARHKSLSMSSHYTHLRTADLRDSLNAI